MTPDGADATLGGLTRAARTTAAVHADALAVLSRWTAPSADQEAVRQALIAYLTARPDACSRSCAPGHLTASALVLDADGSRALLTLHPRVGAWLQLGGHVEPDDATLAGAALREAREESGIADLSISAEPVHLDVRYLVRAPAGAVAVRSDESTDLRWWPLAELPDEVAFGRALAP